MRLRKTLLLPIISISIVTALVSLIIGYRINLSNLRQSLEAREEERVSGIHSITKSIIETEIRKLSAVANLLKKTPSCRKPLLPIPPPETGSL